MEPRNKDKNIYGHSFGEFLNFNITKLTKKKKHKKERKNMANTQSQVVHYVLSICL